ncbi:MAG: LacI family transcriptional regulator [Chloroflexi bacterium]|nr:LacI family transcriptional regulator [Chloroflexota bacterium]MCI0645312.1 LacI family transcriptional regulator [Chloroflexota bacterium]MCI0729534.1 LacI family transcriptional regulator [Chloroflexota bacterium]
MSRDKSAREKITIKRVAREAAVSTQTVSRVLNDRPDVAPETRQRVQEVMERLNYQPNAIARSLVSSRTRTLGLLTADFSDYFFTQVIAGAEVEARKHDYFFMLGSTERNPQDEPEYLRLLTERHVEGILFARPSTEPDNRHLSKLLGDGVPVVTTAYYLPDETLTVVDVDNVDGGQQATRCLLEYGHQRVAMITGPTGWRSVKDRAKGYGRALEEAGLAVDPGLIVEGDWSYESGYQAMLALLARRVAFTALFAQNDRMAIGAIRALSEAGRRVPQDVSVAGYDDIPVAGYCTPPLTTIRQPMQELGALATRLLIQAIEKPGSIRGEVLLKGELVRRDSCTVVDAAE